MKSFRWIVALALCSGCAGRLKDIPVDVDPAAIAQQMESTPAPTPNDDAAALRAAADRDVSGLTTDPAPSFDPLYFAFNSDELLTESRDRLVGVADFLQNHPKVAVTITGHCDERGTAEYNLALGDRRARAARDYLSRLGVPQDRVQILSYGSERPALVGEGEDVWAKNRRDEFVVAGLKAAAEPTSMNAQ